MTVAGFDRMGGGGGAMAHGLVTFHALSPCGWRAWRGGVFAGGAPTDRAHGRCAAGRVNGGFRAAAITRSLSPQLCWGD